MLRNGGEESLLVWKRRNERQQLRPLEQIDRVRRRVEQCNRFDDDSSTLRIAHGTAADPAVGLEDGSVDVNETEVGKAM